jgi:transposase
MQVLEPLFAKALKLESPWEVKRIEFNEEEKELKIFIDFPRGSTFKCPKCGREARVYDTKEKRWRHLNFFQYKCYLIVRVPRIKCKKDGILQVELPWARSGADFTFLFESFAMTLCREMPVNKVSKIIGEDDNKLWRMMRYYVEEARKLEDYSEVKSIGMDETSKKKRHDYVTIVADLNKRKTIFVAEGRGAEVVEKFKEDLVVHGGFPEDITNASIDMSPAYIKGINDNFTNAEITFDKFHIMKILNEAVDKVRKSEVKEQDILRSTRYIWLRNRGNLTEAQKETLMAIESMPRLNLKTVRAMHIRENFQEIYKEKGREGFERALKKWYFWATHSRIEPIKEAAKTIKRHWDGVIRWYESRINNGILEGLNSLIQAAKAKARGYKTFMNFETIIYLLTGKLDFSRVGLPT